MHVSAGCDEKQDFFPLFYLSSSIFMRPLKSFNRNQRYRPFKQPLLCPLYNIRMPAARISEKG
ncbi:hypothetical protein CLOSTHATH_03159 [Hungatella hathewayi DSM 13479]|uniref:Uncharacterized protein n=1 Tax=Hungatella hathewayi DSM 13479 TaxID=566550 RepID=D3AHS0_9FIRM|nr:hypothetical protein CLOSTHATH_03159 [Hungatella hathewayi DSM 13479]